MASASFTKLKDGSWGLRISHPATETIAPGMTLTVTKRDGSSSTETVGSVIWVGTDDRAPGNKVAFATLVKQARASGGRKLRPGMECPACHSEDLNGQLRCWECGFQG